jgi:pimeloyl-ACP methyl ester carboxylesterase
MTGSDTSPPAKRLLAREMFSFAYMRAAATFAPAVSLGQLGAGQPVMVVPGFMASDRTTGRLRRSLTNAGFVVHGWGLGRNRGTRADTLHRLDQKIASLELGTPIILVGWSLGGLVAREYAKFAPLRVAKVISLGSPFSGDPRANNAWRAYELIAGHKVDAPPIEMVLAEKPPVPTTAFWSKRDGVVAPASARGLGHESDHQIELDCTHMAFVARPDAIRAVAKAMLA